jgi:transaldolase
MTTESPTAALSALGVSIWLDDLSRDRIQSGGLQSLIENRNVVGVTTNPTIFAAALAKGTTYDAQVSTLAAAGTSVTDAVFEITTDDVAAASDIFRPIYDATGGFDGRVSIEVEPGLAHDAAGTIEQAKQLWAKVDRPNAMIKIPATVEGLEAITATIAAGISVNVTLIFSLERHREVIEAYLDGLEQAKAAGVDLSTIHSVASFFVSTPRSTSDSRRSGPTRRSRSRARRGSPTRSSPTRCTRRRSRPIAPVRSWLPARTSSAPSGRRRASRTRASRTPST